MTRSTKLGFEIAAFAMVIIALLANAAALTAMRSGLAWADFASEFAITVSVFTSFFCVFVGMAEERRRVGRRNPASMTIKDELNQRKLRAQGPRVQFR